MVFFYVILKRIVPMILAWYVSSYVFSKVDKKCKVTDKIMVLFEINLKWEVFIYMLASLLLMLLIAASGIYINVYIINTNVSLYSFVSGIPLGIVFYIVNKNRLLLKNI